MMQKCIIFTEVCKKKLDSFLNARLFSKIFFYILNMQSNIAERFHKCKYLKWKKIYFKALHKSGDYTYILPTQPFEGDFLYLNLRCSI